MLGPVQALLRSIIVGTSSPKGDPLITVVPSLLEKVFNFSLTTPPQLLSKS